MYKPVILIGNGCRQNPELVKYLCSLGIPVLTTWMAIDLVPENSPVFCGRPGGMGQRAANIIQQKADVLYIYGARLDEQQVYFDYKGFAPRANKHVVDIDKAELDKLFDYGYSIRMGDLSKEPLRFPAQAILIDPKWLSWCKALYARFRSELDGVENDKYVDPFYFMRLLSEHCQPDDILAMGSSGGAPNSFLQTFKIKEGQKFCNCSTLGLMGADIPMAIGACIGSGKKRTICVTGDGGFMMNIQELEVVRRLELPIKFFVYNNNGYGSIRAMQNARFDGNKVACDPDSGLTLPRLSDEGKGYGGIGDAFGIETFQFDNNNQLGGYLFHPKTGWLSNNNPYIIELNIDPNWTQYPRIINIMDGNKFIKTPMQDMTPQIDDLAELMEYGND